MHLLLRRRGQPVTRLPLGEAPVTVGGGAQDTLCVPGLAPAAIHVEREGRHAFVTCATPFAVDGVVAPVEQRRLFLSGEVLCLPREGSLELVDEAHSADPGTAALVRGLLHAADPAPPPSVGPSLTCLVGLDTGRVHLLIGSQLELGRAPNAHIRVRDRAASRRHARLIREPDGWHLENRNAANGVYLNNQLVEGKPRLMPGDVIEVGRTLLKFRDSEADPPAPQVVSSVDTVAPRRFPVVLLTLGGVLGLFAGAAGLGLAMRMPP